MIIVSANLLSVMVAFDTIQAKGLVHIIRYLLDTQTADAEIYAARKMTESGLPISPMDLMLLMGQIAVTMSRVLTEAEVAAAAAPSAEVKLPEDKEEKKDDKKTKGVEGIKDGSWKH